MPNQTLDILFWLAVIVVASVVTIVVGLAVRRKMIGTDHSGEPEAFTISDLRRMHRQGHLTDEEFERGKAGLIARGLANFGSADQTDQQAPAGANSPQQDASEPGESPGDSDNG